ncbi:MAG: SH3 domain-containing protein [Pseudomonadota bacterium]|nr:SH3 domain-containing protein [Pseudomonadota bacterium]
MTISKWMWITLSGLLWGLAIPTLAQQQGVAVKSDDMKAEPFKDAKTVAALNKGDSVTILKKQGGWMEIKVSQRKGWVRVLSVRKGAGGSNAAAEIAGVAGVATGRAGTGQVVSTTGVRGLGEEDLKSAKFNEEELKKAEAAAIAPDQAKQFAAKGALTARQVNWLPTSKTVASEGR